MSKEKDCNVSLCETLFTLSDSWTRAHLEETACSTESRGETPDIQDGAGTQCFKNPEEKGKHSPVLEK